MEIEGQGVGDPAFGFRFIAYKRLPLFLVFIFILIVWRGNRGLNCRAVAGMSVHSTEIAYSPRSHSSLSLRAHPSETKTGQGKEGYSQAAVNREASLGSRYYPRCRYLRLKLNRPAEKMHGHPKKPV